MMVVASILTGGDLDASEAFLLGMLVGALVLAVLIGGRGGHRR